MVDTEDRHAVFRRSTGGCHRCIGPSGSAAKADTALDGTVQPGEIL